MVATDNSILLRTPSGWLASGFGSGLSPVAPGTAGSLAALLPAWLYCEYLPFNIWVTVIVILLAFILGCVICQNAGRQLGVHDHGALVWDEFVGQWLVLLVVTPTVVNWLLAFALFRLFDIWKPWPIGYFDKKVSGGFGVMLDDVLAAIYAMPLAYGLSYLIGDLYFTQ